MSQPTAKELEVAKTLGPKGVQAADTLSSMNKVKPKSAYSMMTTGNYGGRKSRKRRRVKKSRRTRR